MVLGGACIGGGLLLGIVGTPPAAIGAPVAIGEGAPTKAKGFVMGCAAGGIVAVAAAAGCLGGLVLRNILGPEGGGPEAPRGPVRGGGCMAAGLTGPRTRSL